MASVFGIIVVLSGVGAIVGFLPIANGESQTGLTTMQIDPGMDTGPMLLREATEIGADETAPELARRMAELGAPLVVDSLRKLERGEIATRRGNFRKISGRNQLIGRVVALKYSGLLAQVTLAIGEQHITAIITADAARELRLKVGERAAALVKSTEVMILRV